MSTKSRDTQRFLQDLTDWHAKRAATLHNHVAYLNKFFGTQGGAVQVCAGLQQEAETNQAFADRLQELRGLPWGSIMNMVQRKEKGGAHA